MTRSASARRQRERLLAQNMLAGLERAHSPLRMHRVGKRNVDGIDRRMLHETIRCRPGIGGGNAELGLKLGEPGGIAACDCGDLLSSAQNRGQQPLSRGPGGSEAPAGQNFFNSSIRALRPFLL